MNGARHFRHGLAVLTVLLAHAPAHAERPGGSTPVLLELTDAASILYNSDNRDTRPRSVATRANDEWGLSYNRLNVQATRGKFTLTLRLDSAWFFVSPSPADVARNVTRAESFADETERASFYRAKATEAGIELSNRYINWLYPAKYTLLYTDRDFEISLGDTTAQLGRGLVLSLRKLDELASDNTLRGARIAARFRAGDARVKLTALGGSVNPLRIDEASGRYLGVDDSVTPGFVALSEAGMPRAIATDFVPEADGCDRSGTCSYAPDRVLAGQFEIGMKGLTLGTQGSLLLRTAALSPDVIRTADRITTVSQSVELPRILDHGALYLEAAVQQLAHDDEDEPNVDLGHAVYLAATWAEPAFSLLAEAKHYRRFFPLLANVSSARAREFSTLSYSAPPTTEEVWNDTEFGNFNTCVTGGRLRGDAHLDRLRSVFAWVGHAVSFAESVANEACDVRSEAANRIWDLATGLELHDQTRATRAEASLGTRFDTTDRALRGPDGTTHVFYRELYLRYDVTGPLFGPFAFELQGFHRRRRETVGGPADAWMEGQHSTGIDFRENLSFAFGVEYDSRPEVPDTYLNVMLSYRPLDALTLALFAGQRRGALRCVGGVCRVYPPFEGARLDATIRY